MSSTTEEQDSTQASTSSSNQRADDEGANTSGHDKGVLGSEGSDEGDPEIVGSRGLDDRVVAQAVRAKNSFIGSHIRIEGDFIASGDDRRLAVSPIDITRSIEQASGRFAKPKYFADLGAALAKPNVILLTGQRCGKRTAAGVALRRSNHDPILQLPSGIPIASLVDAVERASNRSAKAGILVESVDVDTLRMLAGFEMQRLREVLQRGTAVVLTAQAADAAPRGMAEVVTIACASPTPKSIVESSGASESTKRTAIDALEVLQGHALSPSDVENLLERASEFKESAEELARAFDVQATDAALDQWLGTERDAGDIAALAAAATLDGAPIVDVDRASRALRDEFANDRQEEADQGVMTFKAVDRGWPSGMVEVAHTTRGTYFGNHAVETASVCEPHTRARILSFLWRRLGPDFRTPLIDWLRALARDRDAEVRYGAAMSAGVLFTIDPVMTERELIKPWALDERFARRLCAAIALGAPVAIGADPSGARGLIRRWCESADKRLRHVAVLAYGGLLGAWDPESAAATHLWQIGADTPDLTRSADISLASLMAAGGSAARPRATVVGLLAVRVESERAPRRAYALLPLMVKQLTAPNDRAHASLVALVEQEGDTFAGFAKLLARAFTEPIGHDSARAAFEQLLSAIADGRVERWVAVTILEELRSAARAAGALEALNAQLERVLWMVVRAGGSAADAVEPILTEFFPSS